MKSIVIGEQGLCVYTNGWLSVRGPHIKERVSKSTDILQGPKGTLEMGQL